MRDKGIGKIILDLLYPRRCPICHEAAPPGEKICPECRKRLPVIEAKRCLKCGKPVEDTEIYCEDCKKRPGHEYTAGIGIFLYDEVMKETISYFKFKGRREYGEILGDLAYEGGQGLIEKWNPALIVPVPLHPEKRRERGYNQAEEIAKEISIRSGIPMKTEFLVRTVSTKAMKNLSAEDRKKNLEQAFSAGSEFRPVKSLLLIDDIYTTGATCDAAAKVLKAAGAGEIYFLSLCIGGGFLSQY